MLTAGFFLVQCSPFITQCLSPIGMDSAISELCCKGTILQRNYRKMTIPWPFSYNSFVKFHVKKFGSHNMTMSYLNLFYNEVCYKETSLYLHRCNNNRWQSYHNCITLLKASLLA